MAELFIVGVGRSGTSLLQSMFAAHPAVAMLPETSFLRRYVSAVPAADMVDKHGDRAFWEARYESDERLQRLDRAHWNRAVELALRGSASAGASGNLESTGSVVSPLAQVSAIYRALLSPGVAGAQADTDPKEIAYTGDKDPRLIEFLPIVKELFPDSHVIQIVRDPRDVLLSKTKAHWSKARGLGGNLAAGRFQLDLGERFGWKLWGWRYHVVRYEDLLQAPERTLRRLTAEMDLEFERGMLEFGHAARRLGRGETEIWKAETLGPLLKNNTGKWREGLTPQMTGLVETVYRLWMQRYGYQNSVASALSARLRTSCKHLAIHLFFHWASTLYSWYRVWMTKRVLRKLQ